MLRPTALKTAAGTIERMRMPNSSEVIMNADFRGSVGELHRLLDLESCIRVAINDVVRNKNEFVVLKPGDAIFILVPF